MFSSLFSSLFDVVVVASPSLAFGSFAAVDVDATAVVSDSSDNSVADDASDVDTAFVDDSVVPLLLSPDRVSNVPVELDDEVSSGVTSFDVPTVVVASAVVVVDDAESLTVSPPLTCVVVRNESLGSVLPTVVLANGVVAGVVLSF